VVASLAQLAIAHADTLCRAAVFALREVERDDDEQDEPILDSSEGFAVDIADGADDVADDGDDRRRGCSEGALRLLVARLGGMAVTRTQLEIIRARYGEDALLVALSAQADALFRVGGADEADVLAIHRARADARRHLQAPVDVGGLTALPGLSDVVDGPFLVDTSHHVALAIDDVVSEVHDEAPGEPPPTVSTQPIAAVLRVRAATAAAARALAGVARGSALTRLDVLASAADELIVAARGDVVEAVAALVRASSSLSQLLPEGAPLSFALVVSRGDVFDDVVAAADLLPALVGTGARLALDEAAFAHAGDLAELPGTERLVDPRAPWGQERWELSALLARATFRGRDDDVAACRAVLAGGGERARLLVLGGSAGIGKSSLVRAALRDAGLFDDVAAVAWGAADTQQATPYAAVVGMLRALARAPAGHPRARIRVTRLVEGLAALLTDVAEQHELLGLVDVVRELVGVSDVEEADVADRRGPRALRTSLRRAVLLLGKALLVRAGDDRPLVFVVSGAESMDAPTRDVLQFVARKLGARVRIVLLTSSSKAKLAGFEDAFEVTRREVRALSDTAALAMAREVLDDVAAVEGASTEGAAEDELDVGHRDLTTCLRTLVERARGAPVFVGHAVRWAVEGGHITRSGFGGSWSAQRLDVVDQRLPGRIDRLLSARVQRLPTVARQVLGHCAALGSTFMPAAVEFVGTRLGLGVDEVEQAVRLLTETGFLARSLPRPGAPIFVDDERNDDALLAFEHPLLRAAAEQALSEDESRAVHGVVADALEALMDTAAIAPRLARHHKRAERRRQAVRHLVVAVRRARRLDDRQGAVAMATEALDLAAYDEHDTIFTLQLELCAVFEANLSAGEKHHRALKDGLKLLVRAAEATGDPRRQALAFARVSRFNLFLGDVDKADEAILRALSRAREAPVGDASQRTVRDVLRLLAMIRFAARDIDGAHRALDEARRLTPESDRRVLGGLEQQAGAFSLEGNDPLGALQHLLVACTHKRATADLDGEAACLDAIADVYVRCGHLWTALSLLERVLVVRVAIGDEIGSAWTHKNRAQALLLVGDVDGALRDASTARSIGRSAGLERLEHQASLVLARVELARNDPTAAEAILDGMRRRLDDKRDPFAVMESELLSARAKWMRAASSTGAARDRLLKTAASRARTAVELGERRGLLSGQVLGNAMLGEVLLSQGDVGSALPYAQRAAELIDDRTATGLSIEEVFAPYVRALQALGDDDEASTVIARARAVLQERAQRLPADEQQRFWAVSTRQTFATPP
jgi:tetratricopeptide (TPR) repeat protein